MRKSFVKSAKFFRRCFSSSSNFSHDTVNFTPASSNSSPSSVLLTCEHGSNKVPSPWSSRLSSSDSKLLSRHWGHDIGAEKLTREMCQKYGYAAIIAKTSRIIIDVNREIHSETLIRTFADGLIIDCNQNLTDEEINERIEKIYRPYHQKLAEIVQIQKPQIAISIHSFTDNYEGQIRSMKIGILFRDDRDAEAAEELRKNFESAGIPTAINEPWSGKLGFMFALDSVSRAAYFNSSINYSLMIEMRQDCAEDSEFRANVAEILKNFIQVRIQNTKND